MGGRRRLLLDEGDEAWNIVFGGGSRVNVDLFHIVSLGRLVIHSDVLTLLLE